MKKLLVVLETSGVSGQDHVRGLAFRCAFERAGISVRFLGHRPAPLERYASAERGVLNWIGGSPSYRAFAWVRDRAALHANRQRILSAAPGQDSIYLVKVSSYELVERIRKVSSARLVLDFADALWLPRYRALYPDLEKLLEAVDAVTCDNEYCAEFARGFNAEVHLVPSYPQLEEFDAVRASRSPRGDGRIVVGWLGSQSTAGSLYSIWRALDTVLGRHPNAELRLLGSGNGGCVPPFERARVSSVAKYSNQQMFREVMDLDVGLFPLFDTEDTRARGVLKALIYMAGEVPAVCSAYGDCRTLIRDGVNGMLAVTEAEWIGALERLIIDAPLRARLAAEGLATVRAGYSLPVCFEALRKALAL